jgi:hypothetical protein
MTKFKNLNEVWAAIDSGKTVYYGSEGYKLTVEDTGVEWYKRQGLDIPFTNRDGKCLRATCIENWFGSLLLENEIGKLFIK